MNKFLQGMKNYTYTDNGALSYKSTLNAVYDLFALGAAYRERSDEDCIELFRKAFDDDETYAMKCLFWIRDARGGAGERRFFRVCMKWLASEHPDAVRRNLVYFSDLGRWDDYFCLFDTPLEKEMLAFIKHQIALDVESKTPSLLFKWLPSCNTSSAQTREYGHRIRNYLGLNQKQYRKMLSKMRQRINVLEKLMSAGEWDKIIFDKIPSNAGFRYRNAFARRDVLAQRYAEFAKDKKTKVHADTLYPYEVVKQALAYNKGNDSEGTQRNMINKYWSNLHDYIQNGVFNGICVCDVSGSMYGTPINVALSIGMYCAEKAQGPFANHFITFSMRPELVEFDGPDFVEKVQRTAAEAPWGMNTNLEATFDLLLDTAIDNCCTQEDIPANLIIVSDMQFDCAVRGGAYGGTLLEGIRKKWEHYGYKMPSLIFWNVNASSDLIPMKDEDGITFVSGFSPNLFEQIIQGKSGIDLMYDKLNNERYEGIK